VVENEPTSVPIAPSRLEFQDRLLVRSPSSGSLAVPLKVIDVPSTTAVPVFGSEMVTVGGVLIVTVTVRLSLPVRHRFT